MRISDWSSDVCSSDLPGADRLRVGDRALEGCERSEYDLREASTQFDTPGRLACLELDRTTQRQGWPVQRPLPGEVLASVLAGSHPRRIQPRGALSPEQAARIPPFEERVDHPARLSHAGVPRLPPR